MAQEAAEEDGSHPRDRRRRRRRNGFRLLGILLLLALVLAWIQRREIADSLISDTFASNDIRASYTVDDIGPQRQRLTNIVIGDPANPDLTIERLELTITPRLGLPELTHLLVVNPRLYGTMRGGSLSFGDLDPLIFAEEEGAPEFPNMELVIEDGRGLLDTDYGRIGLKVDGGGHLRGGFDAEFAAVSERLSASDCSIAAPSLYGRVSIDAERPHFVGPLRFAQLECAASDLALRGGAAQLDLTLERNLTDFDAEYGIAIDTAAMADTQVGGIGGEGRITWRDGTLNALYDLTLREVESAMVAAGELGVSGRARALNRFERVEVEGEISGRAISLGENFGSRLAEAERASEATLAAPLLARLRRGLARELPDSTLAASFDARMIGNRTSLVLPEARLRGGSGATVLALSRVQLSVGEDGVPRFSGNLMTGGADLPQITGRMERAGNGALELRLAMREFAAGDSRLSIPRMTVLQASDGRIALEGEVQATGPLPGGFARQLVLPIDGTIGTDASLSLGNGCREVRFERLRMSNLALLRHSLTICPPAGRPILRYDGNGLHLAAGISALDLRGELAETPLRIRSGAIGFAYPGALAASNLDVMLGPPENAQRFTIADLRANLAADDIGGEFRDAEIFLASIPYDFVDASGDWDYANAVFALDEVDFTLRYRGEEVLFEPLAARGASLALADNVVRANALMRHPESAREVARIAAVHDLSTGSGHLDLDFDGIVFDDRFQPTDITPLALGVVANVAGVVTGSGRIDWDEEGVSSSGEFSSNSLDLAAAFGPVTGASGTVVFTDLLGLTTAPDQRIALAAINPGIEVYDGEIGFQLVDGELLTVTGGSWPFMGGTLTMRPVDINIGVEEFRTYVMEIDGLQASRFIERMEMGNLAASGTFDGVIPIVFDPDGNGQLVEGRLTSRPPGGHLSYIGELTYEDMGYFANFAFRTLRDLQYDRMEIDMNGPLTGELVTQVRFTGIRQGETAERNIVSRAIAGLPIELRVNIRAPFYKLMNSIRAMYDPAAIRDPRDLGLIRSDGTRARDTIDQETVDERDARAAAEAERQRITPLNSQEPDIQPPESEAMQ